MFAGGQTRSRPAPLGTGRFVAYSLAGLLFAFALAESWIGISAYHWADHVGIDLSIYSAATDRLLHGGGWFLERQFAPYTVEMGDVLYPPTAAILFAPFLVVPALWWSALPVLAWLVWRAKPAAWEWVVVAACLAFPLTPARILTGNPAMWLAVFVAVPRLSPLVLLKPTLAPFALVGARRASWWLAVLVLAVLTLPSLLPYATVLLNARGTSPLYGFVDVPLLVVGLIARRASSSGVRP